MDRLCAKHMDVKDSCVRHAVPEDFLSDTVAEPARTSTTNALKHLVADEVQTLTSTWRAAGDKYQNLAAMHFECRPPTDTMLLSPTSPRKLVLDQTRRRCRHHWRETWGKRAHPDSNRALLDIDARTIATGIPYVRGSGNRTYDPIPGDCGDEYRKPPFLTASGDLSHHLQQMPPPYPTREGPDGRTQAMSGTIWEDLAGFSRAVRTGNRILVSGTTATLRRQAHRRQQPCRTNSLYYRQDRRRHSVAGRKTGRRRTNPHLR